MNRVLGNVIISICLCVSFLIQQSSMVNFSLEIILSPDDIIRRAKGFTLSDKVEFRDDGILGEYEALVLDAIFALTPEGETDTKGIDPGEEEILRRRVTRLASLIRGIAPDVILEAGAKWAIDIKEGVKKVMYYPVKDEKSGTGLLYDKFRFSIALTFHELGHYEISWVTDPDFFKTCEDHEDDEEWVDLVKAAKWFLYNALEDPRVNEFEMRKYRGMRDLFMEPLYDEHLLKKAEQGISFDEIGMSLVEQFGLGLIYRWFRGENCPAITSPKVLEAINKVWSDAEEIFKMLPEKNNPTEEEKIEVAQEVERRMQEKIWPVYQKLLEESLEGIKNGIQSGDIEPITEGIEDPGELSPEEIEQEAKKVLTKKIMDAAHDLGPKVNRPDLEKVKEYLPQVENVAEGQGEGKEDTGQEGGDKGQDAGQAESQKSEQNEQQGEDEDAGDFSVSSGEEKSQEEAEGQGEGKEDTGQEREDKKGTLPLSESPSIMGEDSTEKGGEGGSFSLNAALEVIDEFQRAMPHYHRYIGELSPLIDKAVQHLRTVLEITDDPEYITGFSSGRPDIDEYIQWKYGGYNGRVDFFQRRYEPEERDYTFSLVIDESGSMSEFEKTKNAIEGLVVFIETLGRLGIDYSVIGFSNGHYMHKGFESTPSIFEKERIIQEVEDRIVHGGGTEDAGAIEYAVEQIKNQPQKVKIILVISDGVGSLSYSPKMLDMAAREGVKVIGIGIGEGMSSVEAVYGKRAVSVEKLDELPLAIRDILIREILGKP